jgi:ParB-like chromosome segregation protein Spo0J
MKTETLKLGFEPDGLVLPLDCLLPTKTLNGATRQGRKYAAILASIKEIGLVEPPVVFPTKGAKGNPKTYVILDGHVRVDILKTLGHDEVFCLLSTDDEGFTYNHKVNRIPVIQEHFMIVRAIENGVSEERIAKALNVDVSRIVKQRDLLNGICPEAVEILRDKPITASALRQLRKVKPLRQMEIAELLVTAGNFCPQYVAALVLATSAAQVDIAYRTKKGAGISPEDIARIQRELQALEQGIKNIEGSYGANMLNLVLVCGYLVKIMGNARVKRFLATRHAGILGEFEKIIEVSSLEG